MLKFQSGHDRGRDHSWPDPSFTSSIRLELWPLFTGCFVINCFLKALCLLLCLFYHPLSFTLSFFFCFSLCLPSTYSHPHTRTHTDTQISTHTSSQWEYLVPYHTDELSQRHLQLYCDSLSPVDGRADKRIVALLSQQRVHETLLWVSTAATWWQFYSMIKFMHRYQL